MVVIGITGGTGSGKTTALEAVRALGGEAIDCDALYHELLETDEAMLAEIGAAFPGTVENAALDRKKLGAVVFADEDALKRLNAITHRYVHRAVLARLAAAKEAGRPLVAVDAIALLESGLASLCDATAAVLAPEEVRLRRVMAREGVSEEYARLRIRAQKPEDWYRARCTLVLENAGDRDTFLELCKLRLRALMKEER